MAMENGNGAAAPQGQPDAPRENPAEAPALTRAQELFQQGVARLQSGRARADFGATGRLFDEALSLLQGGEDPRTLAWALYFRSFCAVRGDWSLMTPPARELVLRAREFFEKAGDAEGIYAVQVAFGEKAPPRSCLGVLFSAGLWILCAWSFFKGSDLPFFLVVAFFAIALHELGHLYAARLAGIPMSLISFGFGPVVAAFSCRSVRVEVRAIPLMGYVRPRFTTAAWHAHEASKAQTPPPAKQALGEEPQPVTNFMPPGRRLVFLMGGVSANYCAAVLCLWFFFLLAAPEHSRIAGESAGGKFVAAVQATGRMAYRIVAAFPKVIASSLEQPKETNTAPMRKDLSKNAFLIFYIFSFVNMLLVTFNLLPIPPLDGGRAVQTLIGWRRARPETEKLSWAVRLGILVFALFLLLQVFLILRDLILSVLE